MITLTFSSEKDTQRTILFVATFIALWLASRPYTGIWHDAILYTTQALNYLYPEKYSKDLFFLFGSQDKYTLFSLVHALFIKLLGVDKAALILTIIGHIIWVSGAYLLTKRLLPYPIALLALGATIGLLNYYDSDAVFLTGEPFITPRLYSEGLSMLGLATFFNRNYIFTGTLLLIATAFHPLTSLPALIFVFFWSSFQYPKYAFALASLSTAAFFGMAFTGIPPFHALIQPIDPEWFALTVERSPHLYTSSWDTAHWNKIIIVSTLLATACHKKTGQLKLACNAALLTVISGVLITWLASESLASALLIQLQTWRTLWLGQIFSVIACVYFIWQVTQQKSSLFPILGFLTAILYIDSVGGIIAVCVSVYVMLPNKLTLPVNKWVFITISALFIMGTIEFIALKFPYYSTTIPVFIDHISIRNLQYPIQITAMSLLLLIATWPRSRLTQNTISLIVSITLITSTIRWAHDAINSLKAIDSTTHTQQLRVLIPEGDTVFWPDMGLPMVWHRVERASYYSTHQIAGGIFNRHTAIEALRRHHAVSAIYKDEGDNQGKMLYRILKDPDEITTQDVHQVCQDPALDWFILEEGPEGEDAIYHDQDDRKWYIYQCAKIRRKQL